MADEKTERSTHVARAAPAPVPVSGPVYVQVPFGIKDVQSVFNIIIMQAIAVVSVYCLYMGIEYGVSTTLIIHIVFCTIGYGLAMTCLIIFHTGGNYFGRTLRKFHRCVIHGYCIGLASVLALIGIFVEIHGRRADNWPHFTTMHSKFGLAAMILLILCLGGVGVGNNRKIRHKFSKVVCLVFHNASGLVAYVVGMFSFCFAFNTWWFRTYASKELNIAASTISAIIFIWTSISPIITMYYYVKTGVN